MRLLTISAVLTVTACTLYTARQLDQRYGDRDPSRYDSTTEQSALDFSQDIKPILDSRCVVCHACNDAPCQLKLSSYEGLVRGANKTKVYNGDRLLQEDPTRMFIDAHSTEEWRDKGFYPVLNERDDTPVANIEASVFAQLLIQKREHGTHSEAILPDSYDFRLNRAQSCPSIEELEDYKTEHPTWGMPYGLPPLDETYQKTLLRWVEDGAPNSAAKEIEEKFQTNIIAWEEFFNRDSLKHQLASRYMYEHLYIANIYFEASENPSYFKLVRSSTPPGEEIRIISTRYPFSDPQVERVYYRLQSVQETIVNKTHMPYLLNQDRMQRWESLFFEPNYTVTNLPNYHPDEASNPFLTFAQLPVRARYRFMLEEAQFTIMGFIKGPVCRGQIALNVINDYFWVTFIDPEVEFAGHQVDAILKQLSQMSLPAEAQSNALPTNWLGYAQEEKKYVQLKNEYLNGDFSKTNPLDLNLLWDGDGDNQNATLTVFRHFDSATVEKGLHGKKPQTAWVINYPLLERIHYLLVAGFDVFGNVGHQVNSRIYMDFLRIDGEINFLSLLPPNARVEAHQKWYRGSVSMIVEYLNLNIQQLTTPTNIQYQSDDPLSELYGLIKDKFDELYPNTLYPNISDSIQSNIDKLRTVAGAGTAILPETLYLLIEDETEEKKYYFTLVHNAAHTNITHMFEEKDRRIPEEDTLSVYPGFLGSYPNAIIRVSSKQLENFVRRIDSMQTQQDYSGILDDYGIRRTHPEFWEISDQLHADFKQLFPLEYGLLDFNRLENR